ncbi:MAG: NfeD family protein, partial [Balneolales bacterium]
LLILNVMKFLLSKIPGFLITAFILLVSLVGNQQTASAQNESEVYVVEVEGLIDNGLHAYIERSLSAAEAAGAAGIILHIDTFGGLVDAADKIRKTLLDAEIPVVAFVNKNAASAGALIALASDSIFMSPGSSIGAATVVDGSGEKADEKMQSYMRGLMRSTAEANDHDPDIAEAMVDERIEIEGVVADSVLLTLSASEAVELGLASASLNNLDEVVNYMQWEEFDLINVDQRWQETALRFFAGPVITSILMLMMLGGLYFELQSPGLGFPGAVALVGALCFFAPHYILGLASWEIIVFFIGVLLLIVEIFVLPGFGIPGALGLLLIIFSLLASMIGNVGFTFPEIQYLTGPIWTMVATLLLGIALIVSLARYLPQSKAFNRLVLASTTGTSYGYTSASTVDDIIGMEGVALSTLRPAGTALVNSLRVDVVSDGDFIEKGEKIKVVTSVGSRVMVTKIKEAPVDK